MKSLIYKKLIQSSFNNELDKVRFDMFNYKFKKLVFCFFVSSTVKLEKLDYVKLFQVDESDILLLSFNAFKYIQFVEVFTTDKQDQYLTHLEVMPKIVKNDKILADFENNKDLLEECHIPIPLIEIEKKNTVEDKVLIFNIDDFLTQCTHKKIENLNLRQFDISKQIDIELMDQSKTIAHILTCRLTNNLQSKILSQILFYDTNVAINSSLNQHVLNKRLKNKNTQSNVTQNVITIQKEINLQTNPKIQSVIKNYQNELDPEDPSQRVLVQPNGTKIQFKNNNHENFLFNESRFNFCYKKPYGQSYREQIQNQQFFEKLNNKDKDLINVTYGLNQVNIQAERCISLVSAYYYPSQSEEILKQIFFSQLHSVESKSSKFYNNIYLVLNYLYQTPTALNQRINNKSILFLGSNSNPYGLKDLSDDVCSMVFRTCTLDFIFDIIELILQEEQLVFLSQSSKLISAVMFTVCELIQPLDQKESQTFITDQGIYFSFILKNIQSLMIGLKQKQSQDIEIKEVSDIYKRNNISKKFQLIFIDNNRIQIDKNKKLKQESDWIERKFESKLRNELKIKQNQISKYQNNFNSTNKKELYISHLDQTEFANLQVGMEPIDALKVRCCFLELMMKIYRNLTKQVTSNDKFINGSKTLKLFNVEDYLLENKVHKSNVMYHHVRNSQMFNGFLSMLLFHWDNEDGTDNDINSIAQNYQFISKSDLNTLLTKFEKYNNKSHNDQVIPEITGELMCNQEFFLNSHLFQDTQRHNFKPELQKSLNQKSSILRLNQFNFQDHFSDSSMIQKEYWTQIYLINCKIYQFQSNFWETAKFIEQWIDIIHKWFSLFLKLKNEEDKQVQDIILREILITVLKFNSPQNKIKMKEFIEHLIKNEGYVLDFECNKQFNLLMNNQQELRTVQQLNEESETKFKIDDYSLQTNVNLNEQLKTIVNTKINDKEKSDSGSANKFFSDSKSDNSNSILVDLEGIIFTLLSHCPKCNFKLDLKNIINVFKESDDDPQMILFPNDLKCISCNNIQNAKIKLENWSDCILMSPHQLFRNKIMPLKTDDLETARTFIRLQTYQDNTNIHLQEIWMNIFFWCRFFSFPTISLDDFFMDEIYNLKQFTDVETDIKFNMINSNLKEQVDQKYLFFKKLISRILKGTNTLSNKQNLTSIIQNINPDSIVIYEKEIHDDDTQRNMKNIDIGLNSNNSLSNRQNESKPTKDAHLNQDMHQENVENINLKKADSLGNDSIKENKEENKAENNDNDNEEQLKKNSIDESQIDSQIQSTVHKNSIDEMDIDAYQFQNRGSLVKNSMIKDSQSNRGSLFKNELNSITKDPKMDRRIEFSEIKYNIQDKQNLEYQTDETNGNNNVLNNLDFEFNFNGIQEEEFKNDKKDEEIIFSLDDIVKEVASSNDSKIRLNANSRKNRKK